ncbi:MAG: hypothetical protein QG635_273, partial [Bacteroidota bacterium]|nr:hypothetical protein [Bacteroidota bacterium]
IAYNTVRMYDKRLNNPRNKIKGLGDLISGILPYYRNEFGIDGVMIDMWHALPHELRAEIIKKAKSEDKGFTFWEENFVLSQKSVQEGYEAAVGYMIFDASDVNKMKNLIRQFESGTLPIPFFATPENHNTPRTASRTDDINFSMMTWAIACLIPAVPFIHSGFELGEKQPVNTGLGFEPEELEKYPSSELPLFSASALNWENSANMHEFIRKLLKIRNDELDILSLYYPGKIFLVESDDEILSFAVSTKSGNHLLFAGNYSVNKKIAAIKLPYEPNKINSIHSKSEPELKGNIIELSLEPFEFALLVF